MVVGLNVVQELLKGLKGKNHDVLTDHYFSNVELFGDLHEKQKIPWVLLITSHRVFQKC